MFCPCDCKPVTWLQLWMPPGSGITNGSSLHVDTENQTWGPLED